MAEFGNSASTVADMCSRAKVSTRTFYDHFDSKEGAFLIAYQAADSMVRMTVQEAVTESDSWSTRLLNGIRTYIEIMLDHPDASLVFLRESWRAGVPAWDLRRRILREWAGLLQAEIARAREEDPVLRDVSVAINETMALSIVHGIEGLVLDAIETSGAAEDLINPCISLVGGVAQANTQAFTRIVAKGGDHDRMMKFVARVAGRTTAGPIPH